MPCCHEDAYPTYLYSCCLPYILWDEIAMELTPAFKDPENPTDEEQKLYDAIYNNSILAIYFAYDLPFPDYIDTTGDNTTEWFEAVLTMRKFKARGVKPLICDPRKLPKQEWSRGIASIFMCGPCMILGLI